MQMRALGAVGSVALALGLSLGMGGNVAHALGVPAGTSIDNTATVSYSIGTTNATVSSNTVSVTVAEIVDVVITAQTPVVSVAPGAAGQQLVFRVTNTGNGPETFRLVMNSVLGADQFDPSPAVPSIYLDSDASGDLSPSDAPYTVGDNDPVLAADAFITVFVLNDIPAGPVDGNIGRSSLTADARTGSGTPGDIYPNAGMNNTDAVIGATGAIATGSAEYLVAGITITANKSQLVVDQFGTDRPIPGARVNYTIVVNAVGTGSASGALFNDDIPANTTYVPGTLRLNTVALSDGADADAGEFQTTPNARVRVQLGSLTQASGSQTIEFAVTIN